MRRTKPPFSLTPRVLFFAAVGLLAAGLIGLGPSAADAQRRGRARIFVVQGRVPDISATQLMRWARSHRARHLRETTSQPIPERRWNARLITDFGRAIGAMQFDAVFYDVTGARRFIESREFHVNDRNQRVFINRLRLRRPTFQPGMKVRIVITLHRREVGNAEFELNGQRERVEGSGEVDFTQEEGPAP